MKNHITVKKILSLSIVCCLLIYSPTLTVKSNANEYGISNPQISGSRVTWDYIYFGHYWQNDTNGDGIADENDEKEAIKWRVLWVDGDDAFLLSEQNIEVQPYNTSLIDCTWETCTLRTWLNETFINNAFTEEEQEAIQITEIVNEDNDEYGTKGGNDTEDKIFLLSKSEAMSADYGFYIYRVIDKTRYSINTEYTKAKGLYTTFHDAGYGTWWLRSVGLKGTEPCWVGDYGGINDNQYIVTSSRGIRPALHIDLSSEQWQPLTPATTIAPTNTTINTPTKVPTKVVSKPTPTIAPTPSPTPVKAPSKPTIKSIKNNKKKSVTLSWKKVKNADGYQIQYATNEAFSKKSKVTKNTKVTIKNLKKKKTYSFRVRAYTLDDRKRIYSSWSKVKRVKIKK